MLSIILTMSSCNGFRLCINETYQTAWRSIELFTDFLLSWRHGREHLIFPSKFDVRSLKEISWKGVNVPAVVLCLKHGYHRDLCRKTSTKMGHIIPEWYGPKVHRYELLFFWGEQSPVLHHVWVCMCSEFSHLLKIFNHVLCFISSRLALLLVKLCKIFNNRLGLPFMGFLGWYYFDFCRYVYPAELGLLSLVGWPVSLFLQMLCWMPNKLIYLLLIVSSLLTNQVTRLTSLLPWL